MWDIVIGILEKVAPGYANFFRFWHNRHNLINQIPEENKHIIGLGQHSITIAKQYLSSDPFIEEMFITYCQYIAYALPPAGIKAIKKLIIDTGKTLEIYETMQQDSNLKQISQTTLRSGEFGKISRL